LNPHFNKLSFGLFVSSSIFIHWYVNVLSKRNPILILSPSIILSSSISIS
jgi:hypothetical protein